MPPTLRPFRDYEKIIRSYPTAESRFLPESEWQDDTHGLHKGMIPTVETICPLCGNKNRWGTTGIILDVQCQKCHANLNPLFRDKDGKPAYDGWGNV